MEDICRYAASRGRCLFDFLFNDMHFAPVQDSMKLGNDPRPLMSLGLGIPTRSSKKKPKVDPKDVINIQEITLPYDIDEDAQTWARPSQRKIFMADGKQTLYSVVDDSNYNRYVYANLLSATDVGTNASRKQIFFDYDYADKWYGRIDADLLIFQGR